MANSHGTAIGDSNRDAMKVSWHVRVFIQKKLLGPPLMARHEPCTAGGMNRPVELTADGVRIILKNMSWAPYEYHDARP